MAGRKVASYTITGLKRWSCLARELPSVSQVKALHVYDFDNTLFMSPLPNPKLWSGQTIGFLQTQECFINGGWWHDPRILEATGQGIEKEEPNGWNGWWNEQIVDLVQLSLKQNDTLTILLTGRGEDGFAHLVKRIVASKNLAFDMICLKPHVGPNNQAFTSTMNYKQAVLRDLIYTYKDADEIKVYEDRSKHTRAFRDYFDSINKTLLSSPAVAPRNHITAEVVQVSDVATTLDPIAEVAEIQRMINEHNSAINSGSHALLVPLEIKRTVFFTGYLVSPNDTTRLLSLVNLPSNIPQSEVRYLADNIIITPRPCPPSVLEKIGGIGRKQTWQVTGLGSYESRVWAARVTPIPANAPYHTDNPFPLVVLAVVRGSRPHDANWIQNWQPVPSGKQIVFQTEVGEKVQLRIEAEIEGEGEYESLFFNRNLKRNRDHQDGPPDFQRDSYRHVGSQRYNDENRKPNGAHGGYRGGNPSRGRGGQHNINNNYQNRNARGGRGASNRGNNRGRGGRGGYKSLDDVQINSRYANQGSSYQPNYDDGPSQNFSSGVDGYDSSFPALGGGVGSYNNASGAQRNGDGGLPYGK
ncbi:MAG: hypothetical protein LQ343_007343 [Gyalolechia ehrenbergii]|nr:MAG: hypothetical protein LQ343_007343 [Gyalolechia ehrenbergii]